MIRQSFIVKHRPINFGDVRGQKESLKPLISGIRAGSIPNAFVFTGASGVGKTATAFCLAHAVNCSNYNREKLLLCGVCSMCKTGRDIFHVYNCAKNDFKPNEVCNGMEYGPIYGTVRVFFLDEAHYMSKRQQVSLNLSLDKISKNVIFIAATNKPDELLPTFKRRLMHLPLDSPSDKSIVRILEDIVMKEGLNFPTSKLQGIAERNYGNPSAAITELERVILVSKFEKN